MGKRRHKRRAEQRPAKQRRDQLARRWPVLRAPLLVFIASLAVILGLIGSAVFFGAPSGVRAYLELAALITSCIVLTHNLAMHMLPAARGRSRREPGISERGPAYGVAPMPGGFTQIDIHLDSDRSHRDD
jgi:hypothetical protein